MAWSSGGPSACVGDCSWPASMIVMGLLPFPVESQKVTLVDCSCHWVTSLVGRLLRCPNCVDNVRAMPLSRWTTKCWSTQRGLACRQAREPQEKNCLSLAFWYSPGDWLVFILWLVHPSMRWYNHLTLSIIFPQTSCNKLFSVARIKSLFCSLSSSNGAL
jgi:hypothetical protein